MKKICGRIRIATVLLGVGAGSCANMLGYDDISFDNDRGRPDASSQEDAAAVDVQPSDVAVVDAEADGFVADQDVPEALPDVLYDGDVNTDPPLVCSTTGPAYIHGDLSAFWHNRFVACDAQHKWLWLCKKRRGGQDCGPEAQWYRDCLESANLFRHRGAVGSKEKPHSPDPTVMQPGCIPSRSGGSDSASLRPGNLDPCDTTTFNYDELRRGLDSLYGVDWNVFATSSTFRHFTLAVFDGHVNPLRLTKPNDSLISFSSHPNHKHARSYSHNKNLIATTGRGICFDPTLGGSENHTTQHPFPANNWGTFFWLEAPSAKPITLFVSWIGNGATTWDVCMDRAAQSPDFIWGFPSSFDVHADESGKPWFLSSPCYDVIHTWLKPGKHYTLTEVGLVELSMCKPPPELLDRHTRSGGQKPTDASRRSMRTGTCRYAGQPPGAKP